MPESTAAPIFILGCQRSGTTLLCAVLNRHPALFVENELSWTSYDYLDGSATDLEDMAAQLSRHRDWSEASALLAKRPALSAFQLLELSMVAKAQGLGKRRWGLKDPRLTYYLPLFFEQFPNSKAILLVRDCRATTASIIKMREHIANAFYAAKLWTREVGLQRDLLGRYSERILFLRYEDLVMHPVQHVKQVCRFLAIEYHAEMLDESSRVPIAETRGTVNVATPISGDRIDQWKSQLSSRQLSVIEYIAAEQLHTLGYPTLGVVRRPCVLEWLWYALHQKVLINYWWQRRSRLRTLFGGRFGLED